MVHKMEKMSEEKEAWDHDADTDPEHARASLESEQRTFGAEVLQSNHDRSRDHEKLDVDTSGTTRLFSESLRPFSKYVSFFGKQLALFGTRGCL